MRAHWPDCPIPKEILSPENDVGWNANLVAWLGAVQEPLVLLLLDDHFPSKGQPGEWNRGLDTARELMATYPDIAMIKMQAGNAAAPELPFPPNPQLKEYDRKLHPFKRTNLVPTLFRREWLRRLSAAILGLCGPAKDIGRLGALEFEVAGTLLTADATLWPERMLGIDRPDKDGGGGKSLLQCIANDGLREGRLQVQEQLRDVIDINSIPGIEAFL